MVELRDAGDQDVHEIVRLPGGSEALQHGRMAQRRALELSVLGRADGDVHERVHLQAQLRGVDLGAIALDHSAALQITDAMPAGCLGQPDLLPEVGEGLAGILLEQGHDLAVDLVHGCSMKVANRRPMFYATPS